MPKDGYYFDDVSFNRGEGIDPAKFQPVDDIADEALKQIEEYSSQLYHGTDYALLGWGGGVCFLGLSIITDRALQRYHGHAGPMDDDAVDGKRNLS